MRRLALVALAVVAAAVFGVAAASCGGGGSGGGTVTLAEYFNELEGPATRLDERTASVRETLATSDDIEELRAAVSQYPDILSDFIEDLEALEAPVEAAGAQQAAIDAGQALLDPLTAAVDTAEQAETAGQMATALETETLAHAEEAFTQTCVGLQRLADENAIDVDLGCGE